MSLHIKSLPAEDLEFQMFVLDELADELIQQKKDVIKITIGISELKVPDNVLKGFTDTNLFLQIKMSIMPICFLTGSGTELCIKM